MISRVNLKNQGHKKRDQTSGHQGVGQGVGKLDESGQETGTSSCKMSNSGDEITAW